MRWLTLILLLMGCTVLASAATTWSGAIMWHPSDSLSWYNFSTDQVSLSYINMTGMSFEIPSQVTTQSPINFTTWGRTNITLASWNTTYINMSRLSSELNMSVCGLDTGLYYFIIQNNLNVVPDVPATGGCITFNISSPVETIIKYPGAVQEVQYSSWNGTGYAFGYNQSIDFLCFPRHSNCTPTYQNSTQWLLNWTNTYISSRSIYLTLNESVQGYTLVANNISDTNNTVALSTSRIKVGEAGYGAPTRVWIWVHTFYPFGDWNSTIRMEVF